MKGGHARSGPPPDPNALRRDRANDAATWIDLPAQGREGPTPRWPLPTKLETSGGRRLWQQLWRRPEAVMWEIHHAEVQVALYVLAVLAAEGARATAADRRAALSFMDDLGISEGGRARNRWRLAGAPAAQQVDTPDDDDRASAKTRFRSIAGGAAS